MAATKRRQQGPGTLTSKKMLDSFVRLRGELQEGRKSTNWVVQRRLMQSILRLYRTELEYEKAKTKYDLHIEFLESDTPLTETDRANIKAATAVNAQIGKQLGALRKRKT